MSVLKQFEHLRIQLEAIESASNNFAEDSCVGKGGFGKVYKGELLHSKGQTTVALKRLDRAFGQEDSEFWKEVLMLSVYRHENIVSLLGFCDEKCEKILVNEYSSRRSLDNKDLTWVVRRLMVCIGAARGLAYLHNPAAINSFGCQQAYNRITLNQVTFTEVYSVRASASKVLCCAFSSDGKLLASGGHDKKIVLWSTDSLKPQTTLEGPLSLITDVWFSPSMPRRAASSFDKTIRVWDVENGATTQVRFQPRHGRYLAAVAENVVSILDVETQRCLHSLQGHTEPIHSVCWDPNGQYLASLSEDSVRVWSFVSGNEGECIHDLRCDGNKFHSCVFHPSYASILIIGCYQSLELWNMSENIIMTLPAHEGLIAGLAASTVTGLVASASHDTIVKLWS